MYQSRVSCLIQKISSGIAAGRQQKLVMLSQNFAAPREPKRVGYRL